MPGTAYNGMFGDFFGDELVDAVKNGSVSETRLVSFIDNAVTGVCSSCLFFLSKICPLTFWLSFPSLSLLSHSFSLLFFHFLASCALFLS